MMAEGKSTTSPAVAARNAAISQLIVEHKEQYDSFLLKEREVRGLPGDPARTKKEEQLRKAEERAAALRAELGMTEVSV